MQEPTKDDSAPGTYSPDDPGGGPYNPETGIRDWYYDHTSARLGVILRLRRQMLGMSQQEIADRLTEAGVRFHDSSVARIEKGKRKVTVDEAEVLARILGVDIAYLTALETPDDLVQWHKAQINPRRRP